MNSISIENIRKILNILEEKYNEWNAPVVSYIKSSKGSPYKILISTILSLRTKDNITKEAVERLFSKVNTPEDMLNLNYNEIEKIIYPVGFYKTKAKRILEISKILVDKYNSIVPSELDELLKLPGVGRKTANLVITLAYDKPGICVDVHVHRISNRWGYIKTKNPYETEMVLRKVLPIDLWIKYNNILVAFGQTICKPISPLCTKCPIFEFCPKINVKRYR